MKIKISLKSPSVIRHSTFLACALFLSLVTCHSSLTNILTGSVADYGLAPQKRVNVTATLLSPNPRTINNVLVRQDPVATTTDSNGNFAFTNFQWGVYELNVQGISGTAFKFIVGTNSLGTVPLAALITNIGTLPPDSAANYYTQSQIDAFNASTASQAAAVARQIAITNESGTQRYVIVTNTALNHNIDLQAMLNALPHATNRMYPGGGTIELGEGVFYTGGALYTNYSGVDTVVIKGKGVVQTCLVFTNNSGLTLQGSGNNIGLEMSGLVVASTVDSNYFLVHILNNNRSIIEDCGFGFWPYMTNGIGLEIGVIGGARAIGGLSGVWYDGNPNPLGEVFVLRNNSFNALAVGAYLDANHPRLENNFFEADNCDGDIDGPTKTSTWPGTSPLTLGGGVVLGQRISSFSAIGNHFFRCVNPIFDLREIAANDVIFHDNEFELGTPVLLKTNSQALLTLDGITYSNPGAVLFETNITDGYIMSPTDYDPLIESNFRTRMVGNYSGSYQFQNLSGNGAGLTNLVEAAAIAKIITRTNESVTSRFVVVTNTTVHHNIDLQAMFNSMPHATNRSDFVGGGVIKLGGGIFYTGGAQWTNIIETMSPDGDGGFNTSDSGGVDSITIEGNGTVQTCLVFTNNSGLRFSGVNNGISVKLKGLVIASTVDSNYFLVHIANNNRTIIDDVSFGYWPAMTNNGNGSLGLELGLSGGVPCANGLAGLWYDGAGTYGDQFVVQNCNFDAMVVGAVIAGNHVRLYNNFFEGINSSGHLGFSATNTWPSTDELHMGGGLYLGRNITGTGISSFTAVGNHWFNCSNAIVDLSGSFGATNYEMRFIENEFEIGQAILMLTNSPSYLFIDGCTWSLPSIKNFTTDGNSFTPIGVNTGNNAHFRVRQADHYYGAYNYDTITATKFIGDGSSLTNIPFATSFTSTNGYFYKASTNGNGTINWGYVQTNAPTTTLTGQLPTSLLYGGTPTFVTNATGLISSATMIGQPYDGSILFSFTTSAATQMSLTNLFTFTLSRANSTNFVIPTFSQARWGAFTNNAGGANAAPNRLELMPNPSSPSNSFIIFDGPSALVVNSVYTISIHVDRP